VSTVTPEDLERLGVWNPKHPHADERLAVLMRLADLGAGPEEFEQALVDPGGVAFRLAIRPGVPAMTESEAAEAVGLDAERFRQVFLAAGLSVPEPDVPAYSTDDLKLIEIVRLGTPLYGWDELIQLVRVVGASIARIADAASSIFFASVAPRLADDPVGTRSLEANDLSAAMVSQVGHTFEVLLRHHLIAASRIGETPAAEGVDTRTLGVGFVDMSGSTALAQQLDLGTLSRLISDFEATTGEIVSSCGGRVVKFIGDAVMFVADDAAKACRIAVDVFDECDRHEMIPPLRCGLAYGQVAAQSGDCFGPVVNLAARLAAVAEDDSILVSEDVCASLSHPEDGFRFEARGAVSLKGFDRPEPVWVLARTASPGGVLT
jgi:class 3 adenylate cyclase